MRDDRLKVIAELEQLTNSKILVFITGDRRGLETRIAMDCYPLIFKHMSNLEPTEKLAIFIYTPGGDPLAAYAIANLLRQFNDSYSVIVPYKALSAGTLFSLGATKITMSRGGLLGPVDPSVTNPLGPKVTIPGTNTAVTVPVNVEDVNGFHKLAVDEWKLGSEANWAQAFKSLSENVHPLALGSVHRAREQIAFLATTLLSYHMTDKEKVKSIVNLLTRERFSHGYLIGRKEAKEVLHLPVQDTSPKSEEKISELMSHYETLLELNLPYNQEAVLGTNQTTTATFSRGIVESSYTTHVFRSVRNITRVSASAGGLPQEGYLERNLQEAWVEDRTV